MGYIRTRPWRRWIDRTLRLLCRLARHPLVLPAVLAGYALVSLWPFAWEPPRELVNHAEREASGGILFAAPGLARSAATPLWVAEAIRLGRLELSLRVRAFERRPVNTARIVSLSRGVYRGNFVVAQDGPDLIVRLRTPRTRDNGMIGGRRPMLRAADVFATSAWRDIRVRAGDGALELVVDGELRDRRPLAGDPFDDWGRAYRLALGNEISGNRPWLGEIERVEIRAGDVAVDYARSGAEDGDLVFPASFWFVRNSPKLEPFLHFDLGDSVRNVIMYVPLGFLFGLISRNIGWSRLGMAMVGFAAVSVGLETAQLFFSDRNPAVDDVMFNVIGGTLGLVVALALRRRLIEPGEVVLGRG